MGCDTKTLTSEIERKEELPLEAEEESEQDPPLNPPFKLREFMLPEDFLKDTSRVNSKDSQDQGNDVFAREWVVVKQRKKTNKVDNTRH